MNGEELTKRGLRLGVPMWRIEEDLDWRENQDPRWAKHDVRKQREHVTENKRTVAETVTVSQTSLSSGKRYS